MPDQTYSSVLYLQVKKFKMSAKNKKRSFAQKGIVRREYTPFFQLIERDELSLFAYDTAQRDALIQYAGALRDFLASTFIESFHIDEHFLTSTWTALSDRKQNALLVEYIRVCEFLQYNEPRKTKTKQTQIAGNKGGTMGD